MIDPMNEITQFSPCAGKLLLEVIPGDTSGKREAENEAAAGTGSERSMYAYAPRSGCPDSKQCQVLMVLRDGDDEASAYEAMKRLKLDELAEENHFLLLFPNPSVQGWNYHNDPGREDDMSYLVRCFASLRTSKGGINGFNGMTFYIADSEAASAMLMTFAALRPINVPAIMIGQFPGDYTIPADALNVEVAAYVSGNDTAIRYLKEANGVSGEETADGVTTCFGSNPNVRLLTTDRTLDADAVSIAWERLFSESRRWQNDTNGTYQARPNFTERGFVGHVNDTSLGCNNGYAHTWYEYIPPQLRGTDEKVPLLFYFHGGSCVPLYGAEQSCWHDIADRENFIVVYPKASKNKAWNSFCDPGVPSDVEFVLALIEHMKEVHPIDDSRIYISGFSSGSMMTQALASLHPERFAAAAPCNAHHAPYLMTTACMNQLRKTGMSARILPDPDGNVSPTRTMADEKKRRFDYRMPVFQVFGQLDLAWPIANVEDGRLATIEYWKRYNNTSNAPFIQNESCESGLFADENFYDGDDERFLHQRWFSNDQNRASYYEVFLAKRCPHALDLRTTEYAWKFMKQFSRNPDGTLTVAE